MKKPTKKQVVATLCGLAILLIFLYSLPWNWCARMWFDADVWGTVSDWVMILVTIITAYYLWATLDSQRKFQKTQYDQWEIDQFNFRKSILPNLTAKMDEHKSYFVDGFNIDIAEVRFAFDKIVDVITVESVNNTLLPDGVLQTKKYMNDSFYYLTNFELRYKTGDKLSIDDLRISLYVTFEDEFKHRYTQRFSVLCLELDEEYNVKIYDPKYLGKVIKYS